jgi:hypothetical protein
MFYNTLQVCSKDSTEHVLVVLDDVRSLPQSESLRGLLRTRTTHIVIISHSSQPPEPLKREIDQQLIRGWSPVSIQPLSTVHTTQRVVHSLMSQTHFTPLNREQKLLEKIANLSSGCPRLVDLTNSLLKLCLEEAGKREGSAETDFLDVFASRVHLTIERATRVETAPGESASVRARAGSFKTNRYVSELIAAFQLPPAHQFVLRTLSVFSPQPVPLSLVDIIQFLVARATQGSAGPHRGASSSVSNLLSTKLLCSYPSPVVSSPENDALSSRCPQQRYLFVPQLVQDALWDHMDDTDIVFALTTAYKALQELTSRPDLGGGDLCFATGLTETLIARCDSNQSRKYIDDAVYKEVYKMLVSLQLRSGSSSSSTAAKHSNT